MFSSMNSTLIKKIFSPILKPPSEISMENESSNLERVLSLSVLDIETIDNNIFRGQNLWKPINSRFAFGGQIVGQALVAAGKTVNSERQAHSLHAYFLRGGDSKLPVIYYVDRTRDGKTYASRNVKATQRGENILTMQVSFKCHEESVLNHQYQMPDVPPPESLQNKTELMQSILRSSQSLPQHIETYFQRSIAQEIPVEIRPINPYRYLRFGSYEQTAKQCIWIRALGHIGSHPYMHRCVAAYLSDLNLLATSLLPEPRFQPKFAASLDHAMWFHNVFNSDEWMLYELESPQCGSAKALAFGRLWRRDGVLAVSVAQEGCIRGKL